MISAKYKHYSVCTFAANRGGYYVEMDNTGRAKSNYEGET